MKFLLPSLFKKPILLLLLANVVIGLFLFRHYGLSWDEPLFYNYADALGYAYSPKEWFSGQFDLSHSYGASGDDHKTRGPAYLLLARNFVYGLSALGSDPASAWHLVNFLFFQLGVYFLYRFATRWLSIPAALFTSAFFSFQPLLWGHAFINPKDPPFLTFFLASVCLGFEMVDALAHDSKDKPKKTLLAAFALGIATSIRVLGPLAGMLVVLYALTQLKWRAWKYLVIYGLSAILVMFITWPFLWENPMKNFIDVFRLMSDNPTTLSVLFNGEVYRAGELPRRYLPFMIATTLTEPTLPLFLIGILVGYRKLVREKRSAHLVSATLTLLWFIILIAYVLLRRPAMYDGMRHFLFILPPLFIFIGFAFEALFIKTKPHPAWLQAGIGVLLILPGINGIAQLHPYEYTYYNSFVGGTSGAFRKYETDYWLTCYKESIEQLNRIKTEPIDLFVKREAYIAAAYANSNINVRDLRGAQNEVTSGDYVLVNTRTNEDRSTFRDAPVVIEIRRGDAIFCIVRRIP
ncbi:MAG TPA: hypothetical protein VNK49_01105 [Anaerolineales bacterium]|nr:hypothetical protein [Anaerolineales bacterium]